MSAKDGGHLLQISPQDQGVLSDPAHPDYDARKLAVEATARLREGNHDVRLRFYRTSIEDGRIVAVLYRSEDFPSPTQILAGDIVSLVAETAGKSWTLRPVDVMLGLEQHFGSSLLVSNPVVFMHVMREACLLGLRIDEDLCLSVTETDLDDGTRRDKRIQRLWEYTH